MAGCPDQLIGLGVVVAAPNLLRRSGLMQEASTGIATEEGFDMRAKRSSFRYAKSDVLLLAPGDQIPRLKCAQLVAERIRMSDSIPEHSTALEEVRVRVRDQLKSKKLTGLNPVTDSFAWFHFALWALRQRKWQSRLDDFRIAVERRTARAEVNVVLDDVTLCSTANTESSGIAELRQMLKESEQRRTALEHENSRLRAESSRLRLELERAEPAVVAAKNRSEDGKRYGPLGGRPRKAKKQEKGS